MGGQRDTGLHKYSAYFADAGLAVFTFDYRCASGLADRAADCIVFGLDSDWVGFDLVQSRLLLDWTATCLMRRAPTHTLSNPFSPLSPPSCSRRTNKK